MLIKLLSNQIETYQDVIRETLDITMPDYQQELKTKLFEELLLDKAHCWIVYDDEGLKFVGIAKITEDTCLGCKIFEIISMRTFNNSDKNIFFKLFEEVRKFALKEGCDRFAGYTNNEALIKQLRLFDIIWETKYFQIKL